MRIRNKRRRHYSKYLGRKMFRTWFEKTYEVTFKNSVDEIGQSILHVGLKEREP